MMDSRNPVRVDPVRGGVDVAQRPAPVSGFWNAPTATRDHGDDEAEHHVGGVNGTMPAYRATALTAARSRRGGASLLPGRDACQPRGP